MIAERAISNVVLLNYSYICNSYMITLKIMSKCCSLGLDKNVRFVGALPNKVLQYRSAAFPEKFSSP